MVNVVHGENSDDEGDDEGGDDAGVLCSQMFLSVQLLNHPNVVR